MAKLTSIAFAACLLSLIAGVSTFAASDGITVSVTGGREPVVDAVVEQKIDLVGAAKILGVKLPAGGKSVRVVEVGGNVNVPSQVDLADGGNYVICWQVPGELAAGKTRKFKVVLNGEGNAPAPETAVSARQDGDDVLVTSGNASLTYSKSTGGMPRTMRIGSASTSVNWADKIYDGIAYSLANHSADKTRLVASGPLRVVYETESEYKDDAGKSAPSRPRATYRFTHYAGQPVARLDARVTQETPHNWTSLHIIEIQFDTSFITNYITDSTSGAFKQTAQSVGGNKWAAIYGPGLLIGVLSPTAGIYDGGGNSYPAYLRGNVDAFSKNEFTSRFSLYFGSSPSETASLNSYSAAFTSGPTVKVSLDVLDRTAEALRADLAKKTKALSKLKGKNWTSAYAHVTLAKRKLEAGVKPLSRGAFAQAAKAFKEAKSFGSNGKGRLVSSSSNGITRGTVNGSPFIENSLAIYLFAPASDGFGLISVYDKAKGREYLATDLNNAPLWEITVKQGGSGSTKSNRSSAVRTMKRTARGMDLIWTETAIQTRVSVVLPRDSSRIRMRLAATAKPGTGFQTVTFPDVSGILPISSGGTDDNMFYTWAIGDLKPSPLVTGDVLRQDYPNCMQFTGIQSGGVGLYTAEEDPQANQKSFSWEPVTQNGTLSYLVAHPVLGWGSSTLVSSYKSPGDVVIGPFHGDWYDACRIYRKWALTAPWCAKGPMSSRADYPKWLAAASNWTIGSLSDENGIEAEKKKIDYYQTPSMVCHVYGYYHSLEQDSRYPEYMPSRLGSKGFAKSVKQMQTNGVRVVPYVQGWVWDQDIESYRAEDADNKAAIRTQSGGQLAHTDYGYGNKLIGMCPGTTAWQNKLASVSKELVGRYNVDGIYYDFLTIHTNDCFNTAHGHAIGGGNFWTSSIRQLYSGIRKELKKLRPDVMMCGEDNAEFVIDLLDTELSLGKGHSEAPLFNAVYHGYTLLFGGGAMAGGSGPQYQGRWWLTGNQLGWSGVEDAYPSSTDPTMLRDGEYYKRLLRCHNNFAGPYLSFGTMLRPPKITGSMPTVSGRSSYEQFTFPVIDGTAWKAPDGSVGIFFLNYGENPQEFGWNVNLSDYAGWKPGTQVKISRWNEDNTLVPVATVSGGALTRGETLEGRGIMALKLEAVN